MGDRYSLVVLVAFYEIPGAYSLVSRTPHWAIINITSLKINFVVSFPGQNKKNLAFSAMDVVKGD
jgi:hypothetical protein